MISVIVPVYNRISTIGRCLSSILNQSYIDWEVIVIDDGSTDGSVELISRYIQKKFEGGAENQINTAGALGSSSSTKQRHTACNRGVDSFFGFR